MPTPLRIQRSIHPHRIRLPDTFPRHSFLLYPRRRLHLADRRSFWVVALSHVEIMVGAFGLAHKANLMLFRVQPRHRVVGRSRYGKLVAAFAVVTSVTISVRVGGWVVGGLSFGFARDPLDEFGHDRKAGTEDYGCEFAHAVHIVSMVGMRIWLGGDREILTSIGRL